MSHPYRQAGEADERCQATLLREPCFCSTLSAMAIPVFRLMSGATIPFDLSPTTTDTRSAPITVGEARQCIANMYGVAVGRIRLFSPTTHALLDDHTMIGLEVEAVVLSLDPEAEHRAEAALLSACGAADMQSLRPQTELAIPSSTLRKLP